ncbi:MAG: hypothetical protein R3E66_23365 [bacterium]
MIPNIGEIIIILIILGIVFGVGQLGSFGSSAKTIKDNFKKGLEKGDNDPIDITPRSEESAPSGPKPGTQHPGVEDAEIEDPT